MTRPIRRRSRRQALALIAGAALAPAIARAQAVRRSQLPRLAVVATNIAGESISETGDARFASLLAAMRTLGWIEDRTIQVERWSALDRPESMWTSFARQIVATKPDLIFGASSRMILALQGATATIPIVFGGSSDPLCFGISTNLARPSANATGFAYDTGPEFHQKHVQLLTETVPNAKHIAYFTTSALRDVHERRYAPAAKLLKILLSAIVCETPILESILRAAFAKVREIKPDGLVIPALSDFSTPQMAPILAELVGEFRLPAISFHRSLTEYGVLMSYDADLVAIYGQAASYVDRILKGAKPADLPIQQPMRFNFIVNLKTMRALGLELPLTVLGFVTDYIE